jgi:hypothetical protein
MLGSLFGRRKRKKPSGSRPPQDEDTIRSAGPGDVVVIAGFSPTYEDAYFIIESVNRYESPIGTWHELIGVDKDRRVGIEWSEDDGLFIAVSELNEPMGLAVVGLSHDEIVRMDEEQSLDNYITYEDERYVYRNSYEVGFFGGNRGEGEGFYMWEFSDAGREKMISVVKWEGKPFEVYAAVSVSPNIVSVYKK